MPAILLHVESITDFHRIRDGVPYYDFAYTVWDAEGNAHIHVVDAALRLDEPLERIAHEVNHARDHAFTNQTHHKLTLRHPVPCIRSLFPIRFWFHSPACTYREAQVLYETGCLPLLPAP